MRWLHFLAGAAPPPPPPPPGQPGPALGMRWSGSPDNAMHNDYLAKHGQLYQFYRTDGRRDSKSALSTDTFIADRAKLFLDRSNNTAGAVMYNWPICVGGTSVANRNAQLQDAAYGGMDVTWRSALRILKARNVHHVIFCMCIEHHGNWYQWGTGSWIAESGYQQRVVWARDAMRRFVRVAQALLAAEYPSTPHGWIYTFSPGTEAFNGNASNNYLIGANGYPGRQYVDACWPTHYDSPWGTNDRDLANATQAQRDTKYLNRWNSFHVPRLTNFRNWCANTGTGGGGDIPTGFHEISVSSAVASEFCTPGGDPADCTNQRDVPINYNQLHVNQGGCGDNHVFMTKLFDWVEDPANYCIGVGHFHELYKHDVSGYYRSGTTRSLSNRHPLAAEVFYLRSRATGPFDIRASIQHCINRRPANFGA